MRIIPFTAIACLCLTVFAGCSPFKPETRPSVPAGLPDHFSLYNQKSDSGEQWWLNFGSPELNRLIETALTDNLSLRDAWARLEQARALAVKAGASRFPDLEGTAGAGTSRRQSGSGDAVGREAYSIGVVSSDELDLWGRVQANRTAAELDVAATREDLNPAALSIAAEVARRWLGIISSRMQ